MASSDFHGGLAVQYTESELGLFEADCRTALSFDDDRSIIEKNKAMGRRAKAKRRAARLAAEQTAQNSDSHVSTATTDGLSEETDCEVPSQRSTSSKIPVIQKGHVFSSQPSDAQKISSSPSKIPILTAKPKAQLVYLNRSELSSTRTSEMSDYEPTSYTPTSGSFTHTSMITDKDPRTIPSYLTPLPKCDISTEFEPSALPSQKEEDPNRVIVVSDANGMEMKLNVTAMLKGIDLELVGLRFL
uniref:Uncharacterized protein n=1 Tax=Caenorhabditis japonica TaxID=281687 RepID=A0A8R1DZ75_CAEJA